MCMSKTYESNEIILYQLMLSMKEELFHQIGLKTSKQNMFL
jgi:hypothetical protein